VRIYIAEDEPLAAQKLMLFLMKLGQNRNDISHFSDGVTLLDALRTPPMPDLLFLDIQMPGMTGLEVLHSLKQSTLPADELPRIIITSAFDQYAIAGFDFGVVDYLLKPYTLERLRQSLDRVQPRVISPKPELTLDIRVDGRFERIRVADIICIEALKDYCRFTLFSGRSLTTLGTLSSFEQQMPTDGFVRIQRSYVVALHHIVSYNNNSVTLPHSIVVPIGKTYKESFMSLIQKCSSSPS